MLAKDIDASLRTGEPLLESLDDGFSPPAREPLPPEAEEDDETHASAQPALGTKSPF